MIEKFLENKNNLEGLVSYHYSPYEFKNPDYNKVIENRPERTTHTNSYLGLWSCTFPSMFKDSKDFGSYIYEIKYNNDIKVGFITSYDFYIYCKSIEIPENYITEHYKYIELGYDVIVIVDKFNGDPHVGEIITLNFDCINSFKRVEYKNISNYTYYI